MGIIEYTLGNCSLLRQCTDNIQRRFDSSRAYVFGLVVFITRVHHVFCPRCTGLESSEQKKVLFAEGFPPPRTMQRQLSNVLSFQDVHGQFRYGPIILTRTISAGRCGSPLAYNPPMTMLTEVIVSNNNVQSSH